MFFWSVCVVKGNIHLAGIRKIEILLAQHPNSISTIVVFYKEHIFSNLYEPVNFIRWPLCVSRVLIKNDKSKLSFGVNWLPTKVAYWSHWLSCSAPFTPTYAEQAYQPTPPVTNILVPPTTTHTHASTLESEKQTAIPKWISFYKYINNFCTTTKQKDTKRNSIRKSKEATITTTTAYGNGKWGNTKGGEKTWHMYEGYTVKAVKV